MTFNRDRYEPRHLSKSPEQEYGYRRGYDQGVAAVIQALFPHPLQPPGSVGQFKDRCMKFRHAEIEEPPVMTRQEAEMTVAWLATDNPWNKHFR